MDMPTCLEVQRLQQAEGLDDYLPYLLVLRVDQAERVDDLEDVVPLRPSPRFILKMIQRMGNEEGPGRVEGRQ